jgi:hypothetical protein
MKNNYFYDLPDELQEEIYKKLYEKNVDIINISIRDIFTEKQDYIEQYYKEMASRGTDEGMDIPNDNKLFWEALKRFNNMVKRFDEEDFIMYFEG